MILFNALVLSSLAVSAGALHSAVVPQHEPRKGSINFAYYATLINDSDETAKNCRIEIDEDLPERLSYWSTNPADNTMAYSEDGPVDISPREAHTFAFNILVYKRLKAKDLIQFPRFVCDNLPAARQLAGVNSVDFSGSNFWGLSRLRPSAVKSLSKPVEVERESIRLTLDDLNSEQATLIKQLNPKEWRLSNNSVIRPLFLDGGDLGNIELPELLTNPNAAVIRYLSDLGPLTNVDSRTRIVIDRVVYESQGRGPFVSFRQTFGDIPSVDQSSIIRFTDDGSVRRVRTTLVRQEDFPELKIDAAQAMDIAKSAVKTEYDLWFLWLSATNRVSAEGNLKKQFWFSYPRDKVVVAWSIQFRNSRCGSGTGIHNVMVDATTGDAEIQIRSHWARDSLSQDCWWFLPPL